MLEIIRKSIPHLNNNELFCTEECVNNCWTNKFHGHFSIKGMKLLEANEEQMAADEDNISV